MRFGLRSLFAAIALVAMICGLFAWVRGLYYVQLRRVDAVLADYPAINKVWLCTNDDVTLEVEQLYFSTIDQPQLILGIDGIDGASKSEIRERLNRALQDRRPATRPTWAVVYRH
jgi:hypothetical protein